MYDEFGHNLFFKLMSCKTELSIIGTTGSKKIQNDANSYVVAIITD